MASLRVNVAGLVMENPTILGSGIIGETGESLLSAYKAGAGAVVTKSIGLEARKGYSNPTLVELPFGYLNAMGLPNPGIESFGEEVLLAVRGGATVIGSVFASEAEVFAQLSSKMEAFGVSAVELNLSCPHASGYGMELGVDPGVVREIVLAVKKSVTIPVFVKPIGVRCVYEMYDVVDIPIIGAGGIETWQDALEYIMAGAVAVQIGSGIGRRGLNIFKEVNFGLERYLKSRGIESLGELVGTAHA